MTWRKGNRETGMDGWMDGSRRWRRRRITSATIAGEGVVSQS
jgi:hypothetical protein